MSLYMQFRIILIFSNYVLYSTLHQWFQNFFRLAKHLELLHCTLHHENCSLCYQPKCVLVQSAMACYTMDTAVCKGLRGNVLLRIFRLKPPISVHLEKDAIEGFRGGTRRSSWRNITVMREILWGQICDVTSPKQQILDVDITSRDFRLLSISRLDLCSGILRSV